MLSQITDESLPPSFPHRLNREYGQKIKEEFGNGNPGGSLEGQLHVTLVTRPPNKEQPNNGQSTWYMRQQLPTILHSLPASPPLLRDQGL